jgi:putative ABC transport system permease protein
MWPGQNALGRRVTTYGYQVIGVAADVKEHPRSGPEPGLYIPYTRSYRGGGAPLKTLAVKMNPTSLPALSRLIHDLEPLAMVDIKSTDDALASLVHRNRFQALLSSAFAGVACILAIVGVYSVLAFWTSQRTREIGLRIALGAQPRDVIVQVMQQGAAPAMLGLVVGLVSSLLLTRVLQAYLSKIQAAESASYAFVLVAMSVLVLLATWIPARRASRVDPMSALRHE